MPDRPPSAPRLRALASREAAGASASHPGPVAGAVGTFAGAGAEGRGDDSHLAPAASEREAPPNAAGYRAGAP